MTATDLRILCGDLSVFRIRVERELARNQHAGQRKALCVLRLALLEGEKAITAAADGAAGGEGI